MPELGRGLGVAQGGPTALRPHDERRDAKSALGVATSLDMRRVDQGSRPGLCPDMLTPWIKRMQDPPALLHEVVDSTLGSAAYH